MGFDRAQASKALRLTGGDMNLAVEKILSGQIDASDSGQGSSNYSSNSHRGEATASSSFSSSLINCAISQYTFPNGRSACTCIALSCATKFLSQSMMTTTSTAESIVTPELLSQSITEGVAVYERLAAPSSSRKSNASVEHLSAEEVLSESLPEHSSLTMQGETRQGMLTHEKDHPLGLRTILSMICAEASNADSNTQWICVLITKTPETVVIAIPTAKNDSSNNGYVLMDSHPRPHQFGTSEAYARTHSSLEGLVQSLESIFPTTDLGPDIPEMMAMMYNSFDLYPLVLTPPQTTTTTTTTATTTTTTPTNSIR